MKSDHPTQPEPSEETRTETAAILGRSVQSTQAPDSVDPKFRDYYERLLSVRNDLATQHETWREQGIETQPKDRQQADAESATTVTLRDAALGRVEGYEELLHEVNAAIQRIQEGRYGICELTGSPIEPERLTAVPWTRYSKEGERIVEANGLSPVTFEEGRPPHRN